MSSILYDTTALKTALENAIIGWYDNSLTGYHGLDNIEFIDKVCDVTGISREDYAEIML